MSVAFTQLTTSGVHASQSSYTTASITPVTNALVLVAVGADWGAGSPVAPTISGFTEVLHENDGGNNRRLTLFKAVGVASGTLSIAFSSSPNDCEWSITQVTNVALDGSGIVQSAGNTNSSNNALSVTLGAFANGNNATYGATWSNNHMTVSPGGSFTELAQFSPVGGGTIESEYAISNQTTVNWTYSASQVNIGVAIELKFFSANGFLNFL